MNMRPREPRSTNPQNLNQALDDVTITIEYNGALLTIDPRTLTMGDKRRAAAAVAAIAMNEDDADELQLPSWVWVILHKDDPTLTLDDVLDGITLGAIADAAEAVEAVDVRAEDHPEE